MADLQYSVGVNTDSAKRSLSEFDTRVGALEKGLQSLGGNGSGSLSKLGAGLAAIGGAAGFGAVIARGFQFNQVMGDSQVAIGKVIGQFQGLNETAAKNEAAKAMQQLIALEPKAAGSLQDLTSGFLATLGASQSAGLSIEQNIDLVGKFANAMANANIPVEQLSQEMRSILTGNIGADSTLAKILGISNEDIKRASQAGQLYTFLVDKIGKLGEAGDTAAVAFSTLQSAIDKAAGALASGLFEDATTGAKELAAQLDAAAPTFKAIGGALGTLSSAALSFAEAMTKAAQIYGFFAGLIGTKIAVDFTWTEAYENALLSFYDTFGDGVTKVQETATATSEAGTKIAAGLKPAIDAANELKDSLAGATPPPVPEAPTPPARPPARPKTPGLPPEAETPPDNNFITDDFDLRAIIQEQKDRDEYNRPGTAAERAMSPRERLSRDLGQVPGDPFDLLARTGNALGAAGAAVGSAVSFPGGNPALAAGAQAGGAAGQVEVVAELQKILIEMQKLNQ
jgi:hypothetical protein